jgi:hypothetical protein
MVLALGAALAWGVSDFVSGVTSRRLPLLWVLLFTQGRLRGGDAVRAGAWDAAVSASVVTADDPSASARIAAFAGRCASSTSGSSWRRRQRWGAARTRAA